MIWDWMMWLYARSNPAKRKCVEISVYCARLALPNFEAIYPKDKRPRLAIEAASNSAHSAAYSAANSNICNFIRSKITYKDIIK